ncbi:MAG TPA: hypothetical protein VEW28_11050 [Candidatus Kapabacteria bacterium]|nr:hypothetical protein [Candidatus Kapabacteria bacterium]
MKENTFTVDLGSLKLSDAQRTSINSAIQSAVSGELGRASNGLVALVPIHNWPHGPILNGIIVRPINEGTFENLAAGKM